MSDQARDVSEEILEEALREAADAMSDEEALKFILDLPEEVGVADEWMALYLGKTRPNLRYELRKALADQER